MPNERSRTFPHHSRRSRWRRCRSRLRRISASQLGTRCSSLSRICWLSIRRTRKTRKFRWNRKKLSEGVQLTVVMLSSDRLSGVSDDEVLLRCAVFLIFRFAACTMLATKRDEPSLCESRLRAEGEEKLWRKCFTKVVNGQLTLDLGYILE